MNAPRSNASAWGEAGRAAGKTYATIANTTRKYSPKAGEMEKLGLKARSSEKIAGIKAETAVRKAKIGADALIEKTQIGVDRDKSIAQSKKGVRKAGMVAAAGQAIGLGLMKDTELPPTSKAIDYSATEAFFANQTKRDDAAEAKLRAEMKPAATAAVAAPTATTPSSSNLGGKPFNMANLTGKDFDELAYAVSSEAALGTDDEYGVAANILTRLSSGKYGNSISEIIRAPGQYEGVYTGASRYSPEISNRLQSKEGRQKISDFYQRLGGRTEFKGQTMLQNRVAAEDPMFDPKGNFYHFAGQ